MYHYMHTCQKERGIITMIYVIVKFLQLTSSQNHAIMYISPSSPFWQAVPDWVGVDLPCYEFLPQHSICYDTVPLPADLLSTTQRLGIQVREDFVGNMVGTLACEGRVGGGERLHNLYVVSQWIIYIIICIIIIMYNYICIMPHVCGNIHIDCIDCIECILPYAWGNIHILIITRVSVCI